MNEVFIVLGWATFCMPVLFIAVGVLAVSLSYFIKDSDLSLGLSLWLVLSAGLLGAGYLL